MICLPAAAPRAYAAGWLSTVLESDPRTKQPAEAAGCIAAIRGQKPQLGCVATPSFPDIGRSCKRNFSPQESCARMPPSVRVAEQPQGALSL